METENNYFSANNLLVHNCDYPQVFTMHGYRVRSAKNVVDEMEWIHKNLPDVKEIFFEDTLSQLTLNELMKSAMR